MTKIPIIDLQRVRFHEINKNDKLCISTAEKIRDALSTVGFLYLVNHGIPSDVIHEITEQSKRFFGLPQETKLKYRKDTKSKNTVLNLENHFGYVPPGGEQLQFHSDDFEYEMKEVYDCVQEQPKVIYPTEPPKFKDSIHAFNLQCKALTKKLLQLIALSLKLDTNFFADKCPHFDEPDKYSGMDVVRLLHYPRLEPEIAATPGTVRCGEHSDYQFVTLLFQDDVGGLEVKTVEGEWIHAEPVPDSIVLNTGQLTEFWTMGVFPATPHKIVIPDVSDLKRHQSRYSAVFFSGPECNTVITPIILEKTPAEMKRLAKSDKKYDQQPMSAIDHLTSQLAKLNGYR